MTDKVQKIREWVKARLDENNSKQSIPQFYGMMEEDARFLDFLDTMQEEPVSEELKTELNEYIKCHFTIDKEQLDKFDIEEKDYMYSMDKSDMLALVEHFTNWQKEQEYTCYEEAFEDGAKWKVENLLKPADGDDLPEIDREVIVLCKNGRIALGHRPVEKFIARPIGYGRTEECEVKTYNKGGWNIPDVKYWLDVKLQKEIEL